MQKDSLAQFIHKMPKAEIHIHLEGAIQPETVLELARRHDLLHRLPGEDVAALRRWFVFTDFPHFIEVYIALQDMIRTADDFTYIVHENGRDMARQNIRYREITVTPYTHVDYQDKGLTINALLQGLEAGRRQAQKDFGVEIRWVFDCPRNLSFPDRDGVAYDPYPAERTLEFALAGREIGVVGFGLGGSEVNAPPEPFAHAFDRAQAASLLSVPHGGETMGPESVWGCVKTLHADRIGHGVRAIEDSRLLDTLVERQIPLEINPTSNQQLHIYPDLATHPFRKLDEKGIFVTVNSDDPPLFNTSLVQEYELLARDFGYDRAGLVRIGRNAIVAAGVEQDVKDRLLLEYDAWAASV